MNPIDLKRYYEVTGLHSRDSYRSGIIGSIIQPTSLRINSEHTDFYCGGFEMVQGSTTYATMTLGHFYGATLRPLTQKEQEKINESR